jgi:mannose-6-phosphate isomerase-like protein (cupin superfamily)
MYNNTDESEDKLMKPQHYCLLAGILLGAGLTAMPNLAQADITFKFVGADAARTMVAGAKAPDSLAQDPNFSMSLRKREASSHVEKHMGWNEELVIQEGDVLLNYGDSATDVRQIGPGEFNGGAIAGAKSVLMHAGDIVIIPAGTWHEEVLRSPVMRYILFKTRVNSSAGK